MIHSKIESLEQLKKFFHGELTSLNLNDVIQVAAPAWNGTTYDYFLPIIIDDDNLIEIKLENAVQQFFRLKSTNLTTLTIPQLRTVEFSFTPGGVLNNAQYYPSFARETKIQVLNLPNFIGASANLVLPQNESGNTNPDSEFLTFRKNYWLKEITLGNEYMKKTDNYVINGYWFYQNYSLQALHLKYPYMIEMKYTAGFNNSPLKNGKGVIYVPDELYNEYDQNSYWHQFNLNKESNYRKQDIEDTISNSWETIINDCNNNNLSSYSVGDTKTFITNHIPIQMQIIAKRNDSKYNTSDELAASMTINGQTYTTPSLTWAPVTIPVFSTDSIIENYTTDKPRLYENAEIIQNIMNEYYTGIENTALKNGIKTVKKYSQGFDANNAAAVSSCNVKIWPFSEKELGINTVPSNVKTYEYLASNYDSTNAPALYLGATYLKTYNSNPISIPLRDFTDNSSSYLDTLAWRTDGSKMEITHSNVEPFMYFGFCT